MFKKHEFSICKIKRRLPVAWVEYLETMRDGKQPCVAMDAHAQLAERLRGLSGHPMYLVRRAPVGERYHH